jgi:ABC-2 type transport system permease protein
MRQALYAEWTKLRTVASIAWLLLGAIVLTVLLSAGVAATTHISGDGRADPTKLSLIGVDLGQAVIAVLAIMAISEEYGTGMIRVSLAAIPRRLMLLTAKAVMVAALVLVAGVVAVGGCLLAGRLLLPGAGLNATHGYALVSLGHGPTFRAATGSVLYLILIALFSLGIAATVRDTGVSIGMVLALLYVFPILAQVVTDPTWHRHLQQVAPMMAGLAIQSTMNLSSLPIGPWAGLSVVAAWAGLALLIGGVALCVRDA